MVWFNPLTDERKRRGSYASQHGWGYASQCGLRVRLTLTTWPCQYFTSLEEVGTSVFDIAQLPVTCTSGNCLALHSDHHHEFRLHYLTVVSAHKQQIFIKSQFCYLSYLNISPLAQVIP